VNSVAYQLAELNVARIRASLDDPRMREFVDNLKAINALAEASPGFVWRLKDDDTGDATEFKICDDPDTIVNLSVWESVEFLKDYVYHSHHAVFLRRRKEWFTLMGKPYFVMWWLPAGHRPTLDEAADRLQYFRTHGNSPYAFNINGDYSGSDAEMFGALVGT
jgi:hypothetical protein